jgi:protein subunit release factor A
MVADRELFAMAMKLDLNDVDTRVIDQRIGMGVGGWDTVIRLLHKPTGIIIEMPKLCGSQHQDRQAAMDALEMALSHVRE